MFNYVFLLLTLGVIKNTIPLNYSVSHSYILSVVAFDCGQKRSEPLLVTVEVKKACSTGWTGEFLETKLTMSKIKFQPLNFFSESSGDIIDVASVAKSCQDYTAAMFLGEPGGAWGSLGEPGGTWRNLWFKLNMLMHTNYVFSEHPR